MNKIKEILFERIYIHKVMDMEETAFELKKGFFGKPMLIVGLSEEKAIACFESEQ